MFDILQPLSDQCCKVAKTTHIKTRIKYKAYVICTFYE